MPDNATWRLTWEPRTLSILQIMVGLLYMEHGLNKLFDLPPTPTHMAYRLFSLVPGLAAPLELFGGLLIALGLFTRPVAFILSGEMAFAYFIEHFPQSFYPLLNEGGLAIILCFGCLYLAAAGGGPISLDALLPSRSTLQSGASRS